jgi:peptidoglycan/LPS O-acetylase OafA/YrhL
MGLFRLFLAISVLFTHVAKPNWYTGLGGELAVESFFLISGFYMSRILSTTYRSKRHFYINRALRILPIYYVVLFVTIIQLAFFAKVGIGTIFNWPDTRSEYLAFLPNISIFGSDWVQFLNLTHDALSPVGVSDGIGSASKFLVIVPAWTLGLEFTFYLIAPFVIRLSKRDLTFIVVFFFAVRILFGAFGYSQDPWSYRFIVFELPVFFLGVLAEKLKASGRFQSEISNRGIYPVVVAFYLISGFTIQHTSIEYPYLLAVTFSFTLFILLFSTNTKRDRKIGELSYPLYLCHILTISSAAAILEKLGFFGISHSRGYFEILVVALSILVAKTLLGIAIPVERVRDRIRNK